MRRIAMRIAAAFGAVAMFVGSTRADVTLTQDEDWTANPAPLSGKIDLAGHKLTVSSLTGDATITSSADGGYEILEYLDSDAKAYVNTGVAVANDTVIDIKVQLKSSGGYMSYVGARVNDGVRNGQFGGWFYGLNHYKGVTGAEGNFATAALNTDYVVHLDKNGPCTVDNGTPFATGNGIGNPREIYVFAMNNDSGAGFKGSFRVYYCRIAYGNAVQRDLKPARRLSDGALGLLDVKDAANPQFYENKEPTGSFTAGPVVSDAFAKPAELHINVASGETVNSTVAIAGPVRLVKEGAGTFVATKTGQTYHGGTDIKAGTFKCGTYGSNGIYGANGSTVTVREGAIFDCDGWSNHQLVRFVLDGGTLKNRTDRSNAGNCWFVDVVLTKDSFMDGCSFGFVAPSFAATRLQMNDHLLTADVNAGGGYRYLYMVNLTVEGGGEIYAKTGGYLSIGGNPGGPASVTARTTTLRIGGAAIHDGGGEHVFGSYVSEYAGGWDDKSTVIKVLERFKPGTQWHATELQNGATLDLSAYTDAWNVTCSFPSQKTTATATFAANATIKLDLGSRVPENGMQLIAWTDATKPPSTVHFELSDAISEGFMLRPSSDGLYIDAAVKTATWTGAAGTADCSDPANWDCYDVNHQKIADALPGSITEVTVSGEVQLDIPAANALSCASFTCDDVSLKGDCNWSGLGQPMNGPIDLAGHKLTVSSLTGNAAITNSADGGYEILEYLDSDAKAYVNTGVTVANDTVIDIKVQLKSSGGYMSYVGARVNDGVRDGQFGGWFYGLNHYKGVTGAEGNFATAALDTDYVVHLDKNGPCTVDNGDPFATGNGIGNPREIYVFAMNNDSGAGFKGSFRVYYCRIAYGNELQRDLKPARRLSDGALGLLDVKDAANPVFYENKDPSGAFTAGPVVSDAFAKPAELHVAVTSGETANSTVAIMGPVRLVKEGAGTFVATKQGQTYTGGTDIKAGTFKCGAYGVNHIYGANVSTVTVRDGATFDCDGWSSHHLFRFVLDGGKLKNEANRNNASNPWFADVTLTKDSFMAGCGFGFVASGLAVTRLQMNDHLLTADVNAGGGDRYLFLANLTVEGGGEIYVKSGGYLALGGNPNGGLAVRAETTTLRIGGAAIHDAGGEHVFGSYVSEYAGGWDDKSTVIKVLDRFKPGNGAQWHATELQDGATLDLSACEGTWNTTCEFTGSKHSATATFVAGSTINVDFGDRKIGSGEKVIGWTEKPTKVKFCAAPETGLRLRAMSDGLYTNMGFCIIVR